MIIKVGYKLTEVKEYVIQGTHLGSCLNKLKHTEGLLVAKDTLFVIEKEQGVYTPVADIGMASNLTEDTIVYLLPFQKLEGSIMIESLLLNAMGVTFSQSTFNDMKGILDVVIPIVAILMGPVGILLSLGYAANTMYIQHDMVRPDPVAVQENAQQYSSNLFNGAMLTREQGGACPLIFGQPFASGILISSAILTSDRVA